MDLPDDTDLRRPLQVLFLCTHNSARSQIAEALLARKGAGRFRVASAGSDPADALHPMALRSLRRAGIRWDERHPRGLEEVIGEGPWDLVITLCDKARERCPRFPGRPVTAHWGLPDPAGAFGDDATREAVFWDVLSMISRRIDLLCSLPHEKLHELGLADAVRGIGDSADAASPREP